MNLKHGGSMDSATKSGKEAFWGSEMAQFGKFSGSASAFCRSRGISSFRFYYWAKKLGKTRPDRAVVASPFIPIEVTPLTPRGSPLPDPQWLAEFIRHLSGSVR